MATVSATPPYLLREFANITAPQGAPAANTYKNPAKGQWNIPGRLVGWEDKSLVRFTTNIPTLAAGTTDATVTILQKLNDEPGTEPTLVDQLKLVNGQFPPTTPKPIAPGSYSAFVSAVAGGAAPAVSVRVYLQGVNDDGAFG